MMIFISINCYPQDGVELSELSKDMDQSKVSQLMDMLSFTMSGGTGSINNSKISNLGLGELNLSYKFDDKIVIGLGTMGNLSGCPSGYTNAEGQFVSFDDEDDMDDMDDEDEDVDDESEDEDCDADEFSNLMATARIQLSKKIPVHVQIAAGYSFESSAPSVSAFVGYSKNVFKAWAIQGGVRFSNVFIQAPTGATDFSSYNIRGELGINWNF